MTTKFLDNNIFTFKILLSWRFPWKIAFWTIFPSAPLRTPPEKRKILFLLSSRFLWSWEKLNRGVSKPGCFPLFLGKVQIVSRTLSGLFLVGALNRPRKRKRTNRENPRTIPEQIGKIQEKSGKSEKGCHRTKKDKKGRTSPDRETPPFETPPFGGPWKSQSQLQKNRDTWCTQCKF